MDIDKEDVQKKLLMLTTVILDFTAKELGNLQIYQIKDLTFAVDHLCCSYANLCNEPYEEEEV